jgi:hypothetical protein
MQISKNQHLKEFRLNARGPLSISRALAARVPLHLTYPIRLVTERLQNSTNVPINDFKNAFENQYVNSNRECRSLFS